MDLSNYFNCNYLYAVLPIVFLVGYGLENTLEMVWPTYKLSAKVLTVGIGLNCRQRFQLSA